MHLRFLLLFLFTSFCFGASSPELLECRKDWNSLLTRMQAQDSACKSQMDTLRYNLEIESNKSSNYQQSWQAIMGDLHACNQKLDECKEPPQEPEKSMVSESPSPNKSYWWAWLIAGAILGATSVGVAAR